MFLSRNDGPKPSKSCFSPMKTPRNMFLVKSMNFENFRNFDLKNIRGEKKMFKNISPLMFFRKFRKKIFLTVF